MQRIRLPGPDRRQRALALAWLAALLCALGPVLGYLHAHRGAGIAGDLCISTPDGGSALRAALPAPDDADRAHCVYCPGFAAGAALGSSPPLLVRASLGAVPPVRELGTLPSGKPSLRLSHSRAPPLA